MCRVSRQGKALAATGVPGKRDEEKEKTMQALLKRFLQSEDGPTATEYAVMLALIIVVALTAIQTLGTSVTGVFTDVNTGITGS